jgi:two-component system LytT family response regulator
MSTASIAMQSGRLPLKERGRIVFINLEQVDYLKAFGNYVRVHAGKQVYLVRDKLSAFENRLRGYNFVRIHRSVIVNRHRISELRPWFTGEYVVILDSGQELTLSRGYRHQLQLLRSPF